MTTKWICTADGVSATIVADSAKAAAIEYASAYEPEVFTYWVTVYVTPDGSTQALGPYTIEIEPAVPSCVSGHTHAWHDVDDTVRGHGGGVVLLMSCQFCLRRKRVDTWAQNASTGEQGLTSIEYLDG